LPKLSLQAKAANGENFYKTTVSNLHYVYKNSSLRWLIVIFFINSLPVAITSNLLSFYVDKSLGSQGSMPLFLITYLLSGFLGALICLLFFKSANKINALLLMMSISAISFWVAYFLDPSTSYIFYFVCVISGVGAGGEIVMLPAIASCVLEDNKNYGNTFFALWASCTKITLAIAAGIFLPLISISNDFFPNITLDNKIKFLLCRDSVDN
jgi:GPH family glycoside/pentoside/hexuronide:cation symporter